MATVNIKQRSSGRTSVKIGSTSVRQGFLGKVIRPPRTALRRMTNRGSGTVGSF